MFKLNEFSQLAKNGCRLEVGADKDGKPVLQSVSVDFKGRVLELLSYVPLVRNIGVIARYAENVRVGNARALEVFLRALANEYQLSDDSAQQLVKEHHVDLSGRTPLTSRSIAVMEDAASSMYLRQATKAAFEGNQQARLGESAPAPSSSKAISMCGFENLNETCYANSVLKLLILSVGSERLLDHLKKLEETSGNPGQRNCANAFAALIRKSTSQASPISEELEVFFAQLQKQPLFRGQHESGEYLFKIKGVQNDAQEFLAKLTELFDLNDIAEHSICLEEQFVHNDRKRNSGHERKPTFCQEINVLDENMDLQEVLKKTYETERDIGVKWDNDDVENVLAQKEKRWAVDDISKLDRFNLHINAMSFDQRSLMPKKLRMGNIDFDGSVQIPVFDKRTNQIWQVSLEPRDVVVHVGRTAASGHYYMYSRTVEGQGWIKHDDRKVSSMQSIPDGEQAKLISFAVKEKYPSWMMAL